MLLDFYIPWGKQRHKLSSMCLQEGFSSTGSKETHELAQSADKQAHFPWVNRVVARKAKVIQGRDVEQDPVDVIGLRGARHNVAAFNGVELDRHGEWLEAQGEDASGRLSILEGCRSSLGIFRGTKQALEGSRVQVLGKLLFTLRRHEASQGDGTDLHKTAQSLARSWVGQELCKDETNLEAQGMPDRQKGWGGGRSGQTLRGFEAPQQQTRPIAMGEKLAGRVAAKGPDTAAFWLSPPRDRAHRSSCPACSRRAAAPCPPCPAPARRDLPSSSSSAVMDLERKVSVVLGARLGGGGAERKREGILHFLSSSRRGAARWRCHFFSTAWISSYSREEDASHCCRILLRLRVEANFFMVPGARRGRLPRARPPQSGRPHHRPPQPGSRALGPVRGGARGSIAPSRPGRHVAAEATLAERGAP